MGNTVAATLGLITGLFIPGFPLALAFARSGGCPDAGFLGPFVGVPAEIQVRVNHR
jgi:hypothetical protein